MLAFPWPFLTICDFKAHSWHSPKGVVGHRLLANSGACARARVKIAYSLCTLCSLHTKQACIVPIVTAINAVLPLAFRAALTQKFYVTLAPRRVFHRQ
jgi:hypothetical protein